MERPEEIFAKRVLAPGEKINEANLIFAQLQNNEIDQETAKEKVNFLMKGLDANEVALIEERWNEIKKNTEQRLAA